jgi:O-antigen/teichoic acid export membrane protein
MKQRLVFGTILTAVSSGWSVIITLFLTPFLINNLGKELYGIWVLVTSFTVASGFLSLLDLGIQSSIVKFVAEYHAKQDQERLAQVISAGLYFFLGIGVIGAIGVAVFAWLFFTKIFSFPPSLAIVGQSLLFILAVQTILEFPSLIFLAVLVGLQQFVFIRILNILQMSLYAVLSVLMIISGYGVVSLGIAMLVVSVVKLLLAMIVVRRILPNLSFVLRFDKILLFSVVRFSGGMFLVRILAVIYNQMDKIIIGVMLTSTLLTDYDIAYKIQLLALIALSFVNPQIVAPASSLYATQDYIRLQELFLKGTKYSLALCLPVIVCAFVLSRSIIQVWIGPEYAYNTFIAQLFLSSVFIIAAIAVGQNILFGMGHIRAVLLIMIPNIVVNLLISIILAPRIGVAGVIWGTVIGTVIVFLPYLWYYLKTLEIPLNRFLREVIIPTYPVALVFGLLLFLAHRLVHTDTLITLGLFGMAGMCLYSGMFILFGLSADERKDLLSTVMLRRS